MLKLTAGQPVQNRLTGDYGVVLSVTIIAADPRPRANVLRADGKRTRWAPENIRRVRRIPGVAPDMALRVERRPVVMHIKLRKCGVVMGRGVPPNHKYVRVRVEERPGKFRSTYWRVNALCICGHVEATVRRVRTQEQRRLRRASEDPNARRSTWRVCVDCGKRINPSPLIDGGWLRCRGCIAERRRLAEPAAATAMGFTRSAEAWGDSAYRNI